MTKKRLRFYLETSFWRRLADDTSPLRRRVSYRLYRFLAGRHDVLVSPLVFRELEHTTSAELLGPLMRRLRKARPEGLAETAAVRERAAAIVAEAGWAGGMWTDALHIAFAMIGAADVLVTWDIADIARRKTRNLVRRVARIRHVATPELLTPMETLKWLHLATR